MHLFIGVCLLLSAASSVPAKLVGGQDAAECQFPYQVSIQNNKKHSCGGTLIKDSVVLSSAQCVYGQSAGNMQVRVGSRNHGSGGKLYQVSSIKMFNHYDPANKDGDASLLFLNTTVKLGSCTKIVQLPTAIDPEVPFGSLGTVSGWGSMKPGGENAPQVLRFVQVPNVKIADCEAAHGAITITKNMICFGHKDGGKGFCEGDSGDPLIVDGKQYGIVSKTRGCALPAVPGVYTDVRKVREWIMYQY